MNRLYGIYAIAGILFLAILAVAPFKDFFSEWRAHQKQYNEFIKDQPRKIKSVEIGIKQIWNAELNRVDRCVSCHVGLSEPDLTGMKQPFSTHPEIYHDIEEFGCTVCHKGQGLATSYKESKGYTEFWDDVMLPNKFLDAPCGGCHREESVEDANSLSTGRSLIKGYNCSGCHEISGFERGFVPSLDGIGRKTSRSWLLRWLKDPKDFQPETRMPRFSLSEKEIQILTDFLMDQKTYPADAKLDPVPEALKDPDNLDETLISTGGRLLREARCISCHLINGKGGYLAPDLGKIASKTTPQYLYNYVKNPKRLQPGVPMPQFGFSEQELTAVVAYMLDEFVDWDAPDEEESDVESDPNYFEEGLALFNRFNCSGCHTLNLDGVSGNTGPELNFVGSRRLYQLEFGKAEIEKNLPSYILNKLKSPMQFVSNSRMPDFSLNQDDLDAITTALLSQTADEIPEMYKVEHHPGQPVAIQGPVGKLLEKYSCLSCHVINGRGYLLATDLSREGSRVQKEWLRGYFDLPYTIRPTLTERMPKLFMVDEEIEQMLDYIFMVLVDDEIDETEIPLGDLSMIEKGKSLYYESFGCQACHQIGSTGGYVGPPLDKMAARLKPGWIYHWIRNPQKYRPDTIEPNNNLQDEEAKAITAFLISLK